MGEDKIENIFKNVLEARELDKFILGKDKYLVIDRDFGEHWALGSYKKYIAPYIHDFFPELFWTELWKLLNGYKDKNILLDAVIAYFIPYYNCSDKELLRNRKNKTPIVIVEKIKNFIKTNKEPLEKDKRGTGVEWNSKNGLWGSITQNLKIIKERGGPDFLP